MIRMITLGIKGVMVELTVYDIYCENEPPIVNS